MSGVKIFYDNKGNAESAQLDYPEYEALVSMAKENVDLRRALRKIQDLIGVFTDPS